MTDFRALCAELADELTQFNAWYIEDNGYGLPNLEALLRRTDAALAMSKPLSRKAQALRKLSDAYGNRHIDDTTYDSIRRALEQLND
jgi:3-methyladenine DNA glycosylase/8-oxoguanine DNA glycosylase